MEELRRIKDAEIEKYKKYLNKAKKIIEGFGEGKSRAAEDSLEVYMYYIIQTGMQYPYVPKVEHL